MNWKFTRKLRGQKLNKIQAQTLKPLIYAIWGVLENKTNATFHPNIGSLKIAVEEEWNKISEGFILKAYKSFWKRVDTISEKKNGGHID